MIRLLRAVREPTVTAGVVAGVALVWQAAVMGFGVPTWLLPAPTQVWAQFLHNLHAVVAQLASTAMVAILALGIGGLAGVVVATFMANFRVVERVMLPLLLIDQSIPKVALAPLFIIWFGTGMGSRIIIAVVVAFLPVVVTTLSGLTAIDPRIRDLMHSMAAGRAALLCKVQLRNAVPFMFAGLKSAVPLAIIGAVVAEFLGSDGGLGYVILIAVTQYNTALIFVCVVLLALLSLVLFSLVRLAETAVLGRRYAYMHGAGPEG